MGGAEIVIMKDNQTRPEQEPKCYKLNSPLILQGKPQQHTLAEEDTRYGRGGALA